MSQRRQLIPTDYTSLTYVLWEAEGKPDSFPLWLTVMGTRITRKEELAAVTVPYGLTKAGFSLPICSIEEGRIPLSLVTVSLPVDEKSIFKL